MSKAIRKVLALSLVSLMLFSNFSFLNATSLDIAEKRLGNTNEPMVEKSEVQVPETSSAKTTSKVTTSKVENTKKGTVFETEDAEGLAILEVKDMEEVMAQETDIEEHAVETVAPVDEIAPKTVVEEESQIEEEPQIEEEVKIPAEPVEEQSNNTKLEESNEVVTEENPQDEENLSVPTKSDDNASKDTTVAESNSDRQNQGFGFDGPEAFDEYYQSTEPFDEELATEQQTTEMTPEISLEGDEVSDASDVVESLPKEDLTVPSEPVKEEPKAAPAEDEAIKVGDGESNANSHIHSKPENNQWTTMLSSNNEREIKVHYEGCFHFVSFAKFVYDGKEEMESRRGGCDVSKIAPESSEGKTFDHWEHTKETRDFDGEGLDIDIYTAIYIVNDDENIVLSEEPAEQADSVVGSYNVENEDLFVTSDPITVEDCDHEKPAENNYTTMVSDPTNNQITIRYNACEGIVASAKFKSDLPIFGGSKVVIENQRGGFEISKIAPEKFDGYVFVKWEKVASEKIPNTTKSYYEVYEAVYEKEAQPEIASPALSEVNEDVSDIADSEELADDLGVAPATDVESVAEGLDCECAKNGHKWDTEDPRKCTCEHCQEQAKNPEEGKVWWDCFSSEDEGVGDKTPRAGAIWWLTLKCNLANCEGFEGRAEIQEGRRASYTTMRMTAPNALNGYKFDGWYVNDEKISDATTFDFSWTYMDRTIEARYIENVD